MRLILYCAFLFTTGCIIRIYRFYIFVKTLPRYRQQVLIYWVLLDLCIFFLLFHFKRKNPKYYEPNPWYSVYRIWIWFLKRHVQSVAYYTYPKLTMVLNVSTIPNTFRVNLSVIISIFIWIFLFRNRVNSACAHTLWWHIPQNLPAQVRPLFRNQCSKYHAISHYFYLSWKGQ